MRNGGVGQTKFDYLITAEFQHKKKRYESRSHGNNNGIRLGPALGCKNLRKYTDKSQTRLAIDMHADNVGSVHETLRSWTRLVIAHPTTSADFRDLVDSSHKVRNSLA